MAKSSVLLIANPTSGSFSRRKLDEAGRVFHQAGLHMDIYLTERAGDAQRKARETIKRKDVNDKYAMVIAGGGDGTVNEVVNGLAFSSMPMSVLPLGITNVLARETGIPQDAKGAAMAIAKGVEHKVSLGRLDLSGTVRYFILMAGIGFDGRVVHKTDSKMKKLFGATSFVLKGIECLLDLKPGKLEVRANGVTCVGHTVIVCNASKYGGEFKVAPDADITAPVLWVRVFTGSSRLSVVRDTIDLVTGGHNSSSVGEYFSCTRLAIDGKAYIQVDGDACGESPAEITVHENALSLIY